MPNDDIKFHKNIGRPKELTKKEAYEAQLEAKRKWRAANKKRVSAYNQQYHQKKTSRKGSRKG